MDEGVEERKDFSKIQPQKCLFPIASVISTSENTQNQGRTLFPCVESVQQSIKDDPNLDWLTNESYQLTGESHTKPTEYESDDNTRDKDSSGTSTDGKEYEKKHKKHRKRKHDDSECSNKDDRRSKHRKKEKKKKNKKDKRKETTKIAEDKLKPDTIWIEESGLKPEEAFRVHRNKDVENLMYGSIYRLDVASYKIKSNILCLGLAKGQSLLVNETKKKKSKKAKDVELRYWEDRRLLNDAPKSLLQSKSTSTVFVNNVENFAYIPIDLPSNQDEDNDQDEKDDDSEVIVDPKERAISQQTAQLNKVLRDEPHNIKTWIELANFQGKVVNKDDFTTVAMTSTANETTKKHSKIINEKKISVIEKALELNPASTELILYHLELCKDVWDDHQLVERWKKVVFAHPNKTALWRKYLLFLQSRVSIFTFRKTQKTYEKCFTMLSSIKSGTFVSHQAENCIEEDMLELFVQYCKFLKQAGHMEKCMASFQAMIELNFLCPEELKTSASLSGQIEFLETFWDSGQPRFGENGAVGWQTWMNKTMTSKPPLAPECLDCKKIFKSSYNVSELDDTENDEQDLVKDLPKWKAWLNVEVNRDQTQLMPWQPDQTKGETDDDCEDPERIVLFDDIKACLFTLTEPTNRLKLVLSFLEVFGVILPPSSASSSHDSMQYFELSLESLDQMLTSLNDDITDVGWLRYGYWYNVAASDRKPPKERLQIVRNIFIQSLALFEGHNKNCLMTIWLFHEFHLSEQETGKARKQKLKEVHKLAKAILKEPSNRNNFHIWEVFAKITSISGDVSESRHVFDSTLSMASQIQNSDEQRLSTVATLYRSYAEMELKQILHTSSHSTNQTRLLHILVSFAENTRYEPPSDTVESCGVSSARILRAKRAFTAMCEKSIEELNQLGSQDEDKVHWRIHCVICCVLFGYVTSGISAAADVYQKVMSSLSSSVDSFQHELLWTNYINLIKLHLNKEALPLKTIKQVIHRAVKSFPNNPMFLDYYLQVELKSNLTGEVRRFFDHLSHNATSPVPWIFAIHYEELRSKAIFTARDSSVYSRHCIKDGQTSEVVTSLPTTGISHRQRALFDRATSSTVGRQCIALWTMYIQFELTQGNPERAKAVFYQALQNCAWAKSIYLDSVKAFPEDIESTIDMMVEKELRVRTPLEEIDIILAE